MLLYPVQNKLAGCDHRENICFCEHLGKLLPITWMAGEGSWGGRICQEGWGALLEADVSRKCPWNINISANRSCFPECHQNTLSKERISTAEFRGDPCYHSQYQHFEQVSLPNISSYQTMLLKNDHTLLVSRGSISAFIFLFFPPVFYQFS